MKGTTHFIHTQRKKTHSNFQPRYKMTFLKKLNSQNLYRKTSSIDPLWIG